MDLVESSSKSRATNVVAGAVSLGIALFIGETFYRFGSFTREVLVFLPTWGAIYLASNKIAHWLKRNPKSDC